MKWTLIIITLLWSAPLAAQIAPTSEQKKLNRRAYESMAQGDHQDAIEAYLRSLELGELNVTWLNLGRAYQKSGECEKAFDAYDHVSDAPPVEKPGPEVVASSLERFRGELDEECPTQIVTRCSLARDEPETQVFVTLDGADHPCGTTIEVDEGTHVITATGEVGRKRRSVYVSRGESVVVEFEGLQPSSAAPAASEDTSRGPDSRWTAGGEVDRISGELAPPAHNPVDWGGVALVSGGVAVGLVGTLFDGLLVTWPLYSRNFRVDAGDFIPIGIYTAGLTMAVVGIIDLLNGPERR